jgi:hypothetical protein
VYSTHFPTPYNHPPLIGWMLVAVNAIATHGIAVRFLVRVPASIADLFAVVLVFETLRIRRGLTEATVAGAVVALSPVLVAVSGFHGNTDPLLVLFIILSAYLIVDRDMLVLGGAAAALAIGVKLVPIVALPAIVCAAWPNRRRLARLTTGFLVVFLPLWVPPIVSQWRGFKTNVLDYQGTDAKHTQWGIVDLARHLHSPQAVDLLVGPGRFAVLFVTAIVPAALVLRNRQQLATAVSLSLALFLLLTPTFGMQYLVWAVVPTLILDLWWGVAYNAVAGVLLVMTYTRWSGGFPWNRAIASGFSPGEEQLAVIVWLLLLVCCVRGIRRLVRSLPRRESDLMTPTGAEGVEAVGHVLPANGLHTRSSSRASFPLLS